MGRLRHLKKSQKKKRNKANGKQPVRLIYFYVLKCLYQYMNDLTWEKIKSVLAFGIDNSHTSFYREKYKPFGFDKIDSFKSADDFFKLPFLEKKELTKTPPFERLFLETSKEIRALSTSGTTGDEPLIIFRGSIPPPSHKEHLPKIYSKLRCGLFLTRPQNMVNHKQIKNIVRFFGNPYKMNETAALASSLGIDSIWTSPELLIHFIPFLEKNYKLEKIKLLRFSSSKLSEHLLKIFHEKFPNAEFIQEYSLTEFGSVGIQCAALAKKEEPAFHINQRKIFCEIQPAENDGGNGEIILTNLRKEPSLFIRYKTGDLGERINEQCECGLEFPLIRLLDRKESDKLKIMGFEIRPSNFSDVLYDFQQLEKSFEVHFYQHIENYKLINDIIVKVQLKDRNTSLEFTKVILEEALNEKFRISNRFKFADLIQQGFFSKIKIEINDNIEKGQTSGSKLISHF